MPHPGFGWQRQRSTEDWLYAEPYRFEFYQAVRLLESFHPRALLTGGSRHPEPIPVRFRSRVTFDFPASQVQDLERREGSSTMTVNFMGLAGAFGPLPAPYSEMVLAAVSQKNRAAADFLDLFNHRLILLLYRTRQAHFPALTARAPYEGQVAQHLYSLIGLGLPAMRQTPGIPTRPLPHYSGLLAGRPRTPAGLERMLGDYFNVPVRVRQFIGGWRWLDRSQWTSIGSRGLNSTLGAGAVLGRRAWDDVKAVALVVGPLSLGTFREFLPGGARHSDLAGLVKFYLGGEHCAEAHLVLDAADVPRSAIGKSALGYTSWLFSPPFEGKNPSVRISLEQKPESFAETSEQRNATFRPVR